MEDKKKGRRKKGPVASSCYTFPLIAQYLWWEESYLWATCLSTCTHWKPKCTLRDSITLKGVIFACWRSVGGLQAVMKPAHYSWKSVGIFWSNSPPLSSNLLPMNCELIVPCGFCVIVFACMCVWVGRGLYVFDWLLSYWWMIVLAAHTVT